MSTQIVLLYIATWSLAALAPGPAVMCSMAQAGFRSSLAGISGIQVGNVLFFVFIALGLGALLATTTIAFTRTFLCGPLAKELSSITGPVNQVAPSPARRDRVSRVAVSGFRKGRAEIVFVMRVLHFCKGFSKLSETFIYDTVTELERQGIDNHMATLERFNAEERPFEKLIVVSKPHRLQPARLWRRLAIALRGARDDEVDWPSLRAGLRESVQLIQPDVVHAHFGMAGALIGPVAAQTGVPLIVTFYGFDISKLPRASIWQQRYQSLWAETAGVTVLSAAMREKAVQLGCPADKIRIVHLARALEQRPEKQRRAEIRKFLSVGRLVEKKGHESLMRAFATVAYQRPEIELDIVGEGPLKERLEHLIQELGMTGRIRLRGALPAAEVIGTMEAADAFALCSVTASDGDEEGTPTVFVEAQMLGLPCVATWHSGIPEVVAPANHWLLAEEGAVDEIARRIAALVQLPDPALDQIAEEGRRHVERNFNLSTETRKLIECYESVVPPSHSRARQRTALVRL